LVYSSGFFCFAKNRCTIPRSPLRSDEYNRNYVQYYSLPSVSPSYCPFVNTHHITSLYTIPHYVQNSQEGNLYYPLKSKFPARVTQQVAFISLTFHSECITPIMCNITRSAPKHFNIIASSIII